MQNLMPPALSSAKKIRNRTNTKNKYVRLRGLPYIHTCQSYVHTPLERDRHAVESAKFPKIRDSLPWTPMNRRAKFDPTFILGGEIRNRTNKQTKNSKRYVHNLPIGMCG